MTLRRAYAAGLFVTMSDAMLAVLGGGELPAVCWLALAFPAVAAVRLWRSAPAAGPAVGTVLATGGLAGAGIVLATRGIGAAVLAAAIALLATACGRLYSRGHLGHDLQALLLALLLVFSGAALHTQVSYAIAFVVFALSAAWTLATRQLWVAAEREAARPGGVPLAVSLSRRDVVTPAFFVVTLAAALLVLVATSTVFVLFPRIGLGRLAFLAAERPGLPDGVSLTAAPRALGGGEVMARVSGLSYDLFRRGLYLRVAVYGELTRSGFGTGGTPPELAPALPLAPGAVEHVYEVFVHPLGTRALAALGPVSRVEVLAGTGAGGLLARVPGVVARRDGTAWTATAVSSALRYRIWGGLHFADEGDHYLHRHDSPPALPAAAAAVLAEHLRLPDDLDPRIPALAAAVAGDARTPADKASRLRRYLASSTFVYSLEGGSHRRRDPLAAFLFEERRGHCEFFATAFAALLRAVGVPARVAGGFAGGLWDDAGEVVVFTAADAHAWTEWYQPGAGWVTDDATPGVGGDRLLDGIAALVEHLARLWDERVLEYGLVEQLELWRQVADTLPRGPALPPLRLAPLLVAALASLLGIGLVVAARWRPRRSAAMAPLAAALGRACERVLGRPVAPVETLRRAVALAAAQVDGEGRAVLERALALYERGRFGVREPAPAAVRRVARQLRGVTAAMGGHGRPFGGGRARTVSS